MKYERFFQKIWTYFRSLSTCALQYINQTAPLFEILHHEKIKTQNVTAMVKLNCLILILPDLLKNILMLHIQTLLKNIKINCFIHCNHWKMWVNIKNIWNDNYKVCIVQMSQSSEGRWDKVVFWGGFFADIYQ